MKCCLSLQGECSKFDSAQLSIRVGVNLQRLGLSDQFSSNLKAKLKETSSCVSKAINWIVDGITGSRDVLTIFYSAMKGDRTKVLSASSWLLQQSAAGV